MLRTLEGIPLDTTSAETKGTGTQPLFDKVDGMEYPELLVCPDYANLPPSQRLQNPRIRLTEMAKINARATSIETAADTTQYTIRRCLSGDCDSYEMELGLIKGGIQAAIDIQSEILGTNEVTAVDLGCGTGVALEQLLQLRRIGPRSMGVTMSEESQIQKSVRTRVLIENIASLKPRTPGGIEPIRSGIAFSIFGAVTYHPLNKSEGDTTFGLLHMINLLEENGLGLVSAPYQYDRGLKTMAMFRELGITETPPELARYSTSPAMLNETTFRVKRRPTFEEIAMLLGVDSDGSYSTYGLPY